MDILTEEDKAFLKKIEEQKKKNIRKHKHDTEQITKKKSVNIIINIKII